MRTGQEYLAGLADTRTVFVEGAAVDDVTAHPAFSGVTRSVAQLYDLSSARPDMAWRDPELGAVINRALMRPRSVDDLRARRLAITAWSEVSNGFLGRTPDHVGGFFAGFASAPGLFDASRPGCGDNVLRLYRRIVVDDLFVTYTIIPPQNSTTRGGRVRQVGVVAERDDGIVVRGAQTLGTSSAIADLLFVSCIRPLSPGAEEHALSFVVPTAADGLRLHCRRPYAVGQPSAYDYPLSCRFDEPDSMAIFDDVFVPWEDVLVYRDIDAVRAQFHGTAAHVLGNTQAQIRLMTKLKFLLGLAVSVCQANGTTGAPAVQEKLGEIASLAALVEGMVLAAESTAAVDDHGICRPNPRFLYGIMGLQAELYPRVLGVMRELSGAGVIGTASSYRDLATEEVRGELAGFLADSEEDLERRTKLFKLVWDAIGSEYGGRHHQYEMFYAGSPGLARGLAQRHYGLSEPVGFVDRFLATYTLEDAAATASL